MHELVYRYASKDMRNVWSEDHKFSTWRRIWVALAESQWQAGLDKIKPDQIEALRCHVDSHKEDPKQIYLLSKLEQECKNDVAAHIRLLGELAPKSKDIIHLGASFCDVTDNADLILVNQSLILVYYRLLGVIDSLAAVAENHRTLPCLGKHAQLTTVGKRACAWLADFVADLGEVESRIDSLCLRGLKGNGTQEGYLKLLGSAGRVAKMERAFAEKLDFDSVYEIVGPTYSCKADSLVLSSLSGIGQSAHTLGAGLRLLQHDYEEDGDPLRVEHLCSLSRYLVNEARNAETAPEPLGDGRRLYLPSAFLAADAVLRLCLDIANGLHVNKDVVEGRVRREMPFVLADTILAEAAKGGERAELRSVLHGLCQDAAALVRRGRANPLWAELGKRQAFAAALTQLDRRPESYVGLAPEQVRAYLERFVAPIRKKYSNSFAKFGYETC